VGIVSTTFWAGTAWASQRTRRQLERAATHNGHNGHAPIASINSLEPFSEAAPVEEERVPQPTSETES
ncbi:MAG: hypothetical protein WA902_04280, partial [Thermosynechococcaceae cyanobacterium]